MWTNDKLQQEGEGNEIKLKEYLCGCKCRVSSAPSICGRCIGRCPGPDDKLHDLSRVMSAKVGPIVARVYWSHRHNSLATSRVVLARSIQELAARDSCVRSRSTSNTTIFVFFFSLSLSLVLADVLQKRLVFERAFCRSFWSFWTSSTSFQGGLRMCGAQWGHGLPPYCLWSCQSPS